MSYLGNQPAANFTSVTKDTFNGGDTSGASSVSEYTLSKPATTNGVAVYVENVRQIPTTAYTVSGTTLTFTGTTPSGTNNVYVLHHNSPASTATHPAAQDLTAANATITGTSTLTGAVSTGAGLTVANGITLSDGDITVASGHGISFAATANLGSALATNNELFEDYEEGTWTPAISISSSDVVDATNSTKDYRKIGDVVFFSAHIVLDGAIPDGAFTITGLPTAIGGRGAVSLVAQDASSSYVAFDNIPTGLVDESGADIVCDTKGVAYASSDRINVTGFYFTSTG